MQKLAFSTNAFKKNTLEEAIDSIAAAGYRGVELMADVPHAYPPSLDAKARSKLKRQIESHKLSVSNINGFTLFAKGDTYHPTWIEDDPAFREIRTEHTKQCLQLAKEMGSRTISIQPGGPLIGTSITRADAANRFAAGLRQILPQTRKLGLTICIEPEPGLFIETAAEYSQFKQAFFREESAIAMNCDVGHLFCVGEDPAQVIRSMPNHIAHVHLEDIGANRVHQHLAPGKGAIDFKSIFSALRDIKYTGWLTVELYPYEATAAEVARRAFEFLRPILELA